MPLRKCPYFLCGGFGTSPTISSKSVIKFWRGKTWRFLLSSQARSTGAPEQLRKTSFCQVIESTFGMLAFSSVFIFRVVKKSRKKHQGKSVHFSNIPIHLQKANSLEFLLPCLKLETLTTAGSTAILTWQTKPNSTHLQLYISDVNNCGQRVSLFSVFLPETTFFKWRENHCWIKGNPCHRD